MTGIASTGRAPAGSDPGARHSFDTLDLLRGMAAFCVLLWHFKPIGEKEHWSAYLCVDLFFVLSGVVIAHAYEGRLRDGWRPVRFMVTRLIRLWPLYALGSAIGGLAMLIGIVAGGDLHPWRFKDLVWDGARAVLFVPTLHPGTGPAYPLNRNAWSLLAELVVNIAYAFGGYRLGNRALIAVMLAGAAGMAWGAHHFAQWDAALNLGGLAIHLGVGMARAVFGFPAGVLLYRLWRSGRLPRVRAAPMLLVAMLLALLLIVPGQGRHAPYAAWIAACVVLPLLVGVAMQSEPGPALRGWARLGGRLSYPIYALQDGCYLLAALAAGAVLPPFAAYLIAALATLALSPVADLHFDLPIRRRLARLTGTRMATAAQGPPL